MPYTQKTFGSIPKRSTAAQAAQLTLQHGAA